MLMTNTKCIIEVSIWDMYNYVCIYTKTGRKQRNENDSYARTVGLCVI